MTFLGHHWKMECFDNIMRAVVVVVVLVLGLGASVAALNLYFPVERWYELRSVDVDVNSLEDPDIILIIDRDVHRDFSGHYITTIRKTGVSGPVCSGGSDVLYQALKSDEPRVISAKMSWWTSGSFPPCTDAIAEHGPGEYALQTCVFIKHPLSFIFERKQCANTIFTVPGDVR